MSDLTKDDLEAAKKYVFKIYEPEQPVLTSNQTLGIRDYLAGVQRGRRKARESFEKNADKLKRFKLLNARFRDALMAVKTKTVDPEVIKQIEEALDVSTIQ